METFIKQHSDTLIQAMPVVQNYERRLASLNDWWGKIALIGKINSYNIASTILDDMQRTKDKFGELQKKLTHNLLLENLQKLALDNSSKAKVAIDILIRNLFERTADVGFLATDDDIRSFLSDSAPEEIDREFITRRLQEYVKKYSVYDEIIILDKMGNVKAHLDADNPIHVSKDPLLQKSLESDKEYTETFRYSDLQPKKQNSLIYSCKITASNNSSSEPLGVLCLCFRFEDEVDGIFQKLISTGNSGVLMILDKQGKVIASSNKHRVPLSATVSTGKALDIVTFKGQQYISSNCKTNGYQGFYGLGWQGQMMTPLNLAFNNEQKNTNRNYAEIISQASHFTPELKEIRHASIDVNTDLSLLVLNGQITSARKNAAEFMPVLEAIKQIGTDIAGIFTESVDSLQEVTVMSSHLDNAGFLAALGVEIMDRNLYERANDCRWWALTTEFRRILQQSVLSVDDKQQLASILSYINALYTVYTNLYIYDRRGEIVAVSNLSEQHIVGRHLPEQSAAYSALTLKDSQQYAVSSFVESGLYGGRHTYIYNASITNLQNSDEVVGGIGIVFDSEPQFRSMLEDALPRNKQGRLIEGCFAVFCDREQSIISVANHTGLEIGERLHLPQRFFRLKNGERTSEVIEYRGNKYILGVAVSQGYREFKTMDNYVNDVLCLLFIPF